MALKGITSDPEDTVPSQLDMAELEKHPSPLLTAENGRLKDIVESLVTALNEENLLNGIQVDVNLIVDQLREELWVGDAWIGEELLDITPIGKASVSDRQLTYAILLIVGGPSYAGGTNGTDIATSNQILPEVTEALGILFGMGLEEPKPWKRRDLFILFSWSSTTAAR